jgi:hypothetical protein
MAEMCIFPECMEGDGSYDAYRSAFYGACDKCRIFPRQHDAHVKVWGERQFRRRVGLMVLQPSPLALTQTC